MGCRRCQQKRRELVDAVKQGDARRTVRVIRDAAFIARQKMMLGSNYKRSDDA